MGSPVRGELRCARAHTTTKELPCFAAQQPSRFLQTTLLQRDWYAKILQLEAHFERSGPDGGLVYAEFRIGDYQTELGIIDSGFRRTGSTEPGDALLRLDRWAAPRERCGIISATLLPQAKDQLVVADQSGQVRGVGCCRARVRNARA